MTPADAAKELLRRRAIRRSLGAWCDFALEPLGQKPALHHRLLIDALEALARGDIPRLMVAMPPGSAKSTYVSTLFPPWWLAQNPTQSMIAASNTAELAERFGRRVRNTIQAHGLTLGYGVAADNAAAGRWETTAGGEYYAAGVQGTITGRRADLAVIDDPVKSREAADSQTVRDGIWHWWRDDLVTRLKPGAKVAVVACMTGDTSVLMADGSEKPLRDIRPGDAIATYRDGALSTSTVANWINHGPDLVYEIKMISGITVRANARHPFLACVDGVPTWIKLKDLSLGREIFRVSGASGRVKHASTKAAIRQFTFVATALITTIRSAGQMGFGHLLATSHLGAQLRSSIVTALQQLNTTACLSIRAACAPFAGILQMSTSMPIEPASCVSTIAMIGVRFARYSAMTATLPLAASKPLKSLTRWQNTCEFTLDQIKEIRSAGTEDVYDIEIVETENFIANGLVSHNTRWHEDDLSGRLLHEAATCGEQWHLLSLPMEAEGTDPLGRAPGERLWADWYTPDMVTQAKRDVRTWSALYQQRPAPESGDYFRKEWLRPVASLPPLSSLKIFGGSDYAVTANGGDWTVHVVLGVDSDDRLYLMDLWRHQTASDQWVEAFCDLVIRWKPMGWAEETGQIRAGVGPWLDRRQLARRAWVARTSFPTRGDKGVRAQSIRGRMAMSGLHVLEGASYRADLEAELMGFPAAKHDDQVDALGLVGQLLDVMLPPGKAAPVTLPKARDYAVNADDEEGDSWKTA